MNSDLFRRISEAAPGVMYLMSADFSRYHYINPPIERLLGYPAEKFLAEGPAFMVSLVHPEDLERITRKHNERLAALNDQGAAEQDRYTHIDEYRLRHREGHWKWVRSSAIVFERSATGEVLTILGVGQDITEQRELEHRIRVSERMASVGRLAAGMAHEINNPLAHLLGSLELISERTDSLGPKELAQRLTEMHASASRIARLVRDLKIFSRPEDEERLEGVSLEHVLEGSLPLVMTEIRPRARIVRDFAATPRVLANEARLIQVFLNLLASAAQAIPDGHAEQHEIRLATRTGPDGWAIAEVSDTGSGMTPGVLKQVFEPFFSTKPAGKGMGLGLAIAFQIVQSMGGRLEAESTPGAGSVFRVSFPPASEQAIAELAQAKGVPVQAPAAMGPRGRILVIDDDPAVADIVNSALMTEHEVVVCTEVGEAQRLLEGPKPFDLIFCDMIMPQMSGADFFEKVSQRNPELARRFIFMTGGAFTTHTREFLRQVSNQVLHKPFRVQAIRDVAREFLLKQGCS